MGADTIFVGCLATDYCVKSTVLDGLKEGFKLYYLADASRGVNVRKGDSKSGVEEMRKKKGAIAIRFKDLGYAKKLRLGSSALSP